MKRKNIPLYILRAVTLISTLIYVTYAYIAKDDLSYISKLKLATEIYAACLLEGVFFFVMTDITGVFAEKKGT
ncbi:MAG: hypothetical protein WC082_15445 [Victivallales bacterium]|nr:hypothetical protein [Eubacteriales bacterium]